MVVKVSLVYLLLQVLTVFSASNYYEYGSNRGAYLKIVGRDLQYNLVQYSTTKASRRKITFTQRYSSTLKDVQDRPKITNSSTNRTNHHYLTFNKINVSEQQHMIKPHNLVGLKGHNSKNTS